MLRVTVEHADTHVSLRLEGALKGPWVDELKRCWLTLVNATPKKPVRVDLTAVGFVASEGKDLITKMVDAGVQLITAGPMMKALVEEIRSQSIGTRRRRVG